MITAACLTGTLCPQLWDGFYINRMGEVYPCCHQRPGCVGNIYDQCLTEILNGPRMQGARQAALSGTLGCYASCNLLDKSAVKRPQHPELIQKFSGLRRLHLSFGEACNIRCVMCSHPLRHAANPVVLDVEVVKRNVDATPFEEVIIQGGEPLFLRECRDYMAFLGAMGKRYTVLTNGLLIDERTACQLAREAQVVSISVNGATKRTHELVNKGSRLERVLENIQRLQRARSGLLPVISGRMTLTPENVHEIPLFLRSYREMGFDRVNFGYVKETVPLFLKAHPELLKRLRRETLLTLSHCPRGEVDDLRLRQLGLLTNLKGEFPKSLPVLSPAKLPPMAH